MTNAAYLRDELLSSIPNDALALVIDLGRCRVPRLGRDRAAVRPRSAARAQAPGAAAGGARGLAAHARARAHRGRQRGADLRDAGPGARPVGSAIDVEHKEWDGARIAEEDPQRGVGRPPGQREDVRQRGAAVRGGDDQPAGRGGGRNDGLGLGRRTRRRARCRSPRACPRSAGTTARSTWSTRRASRASSRTRSRPCACRGRGVRGQRRDGRRGDHEPALGARLRAGARAHPVREHARPRARRLLPRARLAQGRLRPARRGHRDPDRRRARARGRGRPDRHEGLPLRRRGARATAPRSRSPRTCASAPRSTARS